MILNTSDMLLFHNCQVSSKNLPAVKISHDAAQQAVSYYKEYGMLSF